MSRTIGITELVKMLTAGRYFGYDKSAGNAFLLEGGL